MKSLRLSPTDKFQVANLLAALQGGLSGQQGYSIFSNLLGDIEQHQQDRQQARQDALQTLLSQRKDQTDQRRSDVTSLTDLIESGLRDTSVKQPGRQYAIPPAQIVSELKARLPTSTLTEGDVKRLFGILDTAVNIPGLGPGGMEKLIGANAGNDLARKLPREWRDIRDKVDAALGAGKSPRYIHSAILKFAQDNGYGPDDLRAIDQGVQQLIQARSGTGQQPPAGGGGDLSNPIAQLFGGAAAGAGIGAGLAARKRLLSSRGVGFKGPFASKNATPTEGLTAREAGGLPLTQEQIDAANAPKGTVTNFLQRPGPFEARNGLEALGRYQMAEDAVGTRPFGAGLSEAGSGILGGAALAELALSPVIQHRQQQATEDWLGKFRNASPEQRLAMIQSEAAQEGAQVHRGDRPEVLILTNPGSGNRYIVNLATGDIQRSLEDRIQGGETVPA